jgi:regulator of protease activity HflC (stomatin/prohibitin superfamily)
MFLIILGILVILAVILGKNTNQQLYKFSSLLIFAGIGLIALGAATSMFKVIGTGEVGVTSLFGKVDDTPLFSGLNIVNPLVTVTPFNVQTQNYTMSGVSTEGNKPGDDAIRVLTADGLEVVIDLTVLYRVKAIEAPKILRTLGADYEDKIVRPVTRTRIRDNAVYYDAISLYSTKRDEFQARIFKEIQTDFNSHGLELQQLLVRNIVLPATVRASMLRKCSSYFRKNVRKLNVSV